MTNYLQYLLPPVTAVPSGPQFVTQENAKQTIELAGQGIH